MKLQPVILIMLFALSSCEGYKYISGVIVSKNNDKPVSGAKILAVHPRPDPVKSDTITDKNGRYRLCTFFTSLMFGGPKIKFTIVKAGYESVTITTKRSIDTIKLVPLR